MRLFDRVGRRLILTAQGEQLLVDCRRVLTDLNSVRERADVLRRPTSTACASGQTCFGAETAAR